MFQVSTTYLESLPRDCCLVCHTPRTDDISQHCGITDSAGTELFVKIYLDTVVVTYLLIYSTF